MDSSTTIQPENNNTDHQQSLPLKKRKKSSKIVQDSPSQIQSHIIKKDTLEPSCAVCIELFDKYTHQHIKCPRCSYNACKQCHKKYLLNTISVSHCMNCRNRWSNKDLLHLFRQCFVTKTYRVQRGKFLLDRAKSYIPLAMPYFYVEKKLCELKNEFKIFKTEYKLLHQEFRTDRYRIDPSKMIRYDELYKIIKQKNSEIIENVAHSYKFLHKKNIKPIYNTFEEPCPVYNCRGLIEKHQHRCGVCGIFVCKKCHVSIGKLNDNNDKNDNKNNNTMDNIDIETKTMLIEIEEFEKKSTIMKELDDEKLNDEKLDDDIYTLTNEQKKELKELKKLHICKQEDIDSVREIKQNCKPCPECKTKIFKLNGCDTMWCIKCSTGFNWDTGIIITDVKSLHNPHYAEFIRNNPNFKYNKKRHGEKTEDKKNQEGNPIPFNPCDVVTLDNINLPDLNQTVRRTSHLPASLRTHFDKFQQNMTHMVSFSRKRFVRANKHDDIDYALRYLTGRWDERRWRIQIEHNDRFRQTNQEYVDVIITWLVVMCDLFSKMMEYTESFSYYGGKMELEEANSLLGQMNLISHHTNENLRIMNKLYKRKTEYVYVFADDISETQNII
jgi:hypothetical protein